LLPAHFEGDTPHFARRFRAYIDHQLQEMPAPLRIVGDYQLPLIAERDVFIERDCCIGAGGVQTTVTSARIYIEPGVTVHGTVWAREVGLVAALS